MLWKEKILVAILLFALVIRFVGVNPSHNPFHSDEGITYSAATSMVINNDLDPLRYDYPALVPFINAIFFKFIFIPANLITYYGTHINDYLSGKLDFSFSDKQTKKIFQSEIIGERWINALFWGRYVTALFSFGNVVLLYLLAKKLFSKEVALIAATLLAVNLKAVTNAHIGLPDTYNAFFLLLSLLLSVRLFLSPSFKNYLLAGIGVGLSFSVKYQVFALIPFLLTHLYISFAGFKPNFKKLFHPAFFGALVVALLVFAILNPYFFIHFSQALKEIGDVSSKYGMGRSVLNIYPLSYFYHVDYGVLEFISIILGMILSLKFFFKRSLILWSIILPFFFIMVYYSIGGFYVRNFITTTPLLMIFAALFISHFYQFFSSKLKPFKQSQKNLYLNKFLLLIIIGIIVGHPLKNVLIHDYYYTKPWVYDEFLEKSQIFLPDQFIIASHPFHRISKTKDFKRIDFEVANLYSFSEFREKGAQYAIVNMDIAGNPFYAWMSKPFPESLSYWSKPVDKLNNTFWGIAINEMMGYVLTSTYKPWQAPDAAMFLIKIPYLDKDLSFHKIRIFNFDSGQGWSTLGREDGPLGVYQFDKSIGRDQPGSLAYFPAITKLGTLRFTSPLISVKPGYIYKINGFIKADKDVSEMTRNGFLRIDFYSRITNPETVGEKVAVSSRYFGQDWKDLSMFAEAPLGATNMRVSFQIADQASYRLWLDDLSVEESDSVQFDNTPYQKIPFEDYRDLLYPNSHGNL